MGDNERFSTLVIKQSFVFIRASWLTFQAPVMLLNKYISLRPAKSRGNLHPPTTDSCRFGHTSDTTKTIEQSYPVGPLTHPRPHRSADNDLLAHQRLFGPSPRARNFIGPASIVHLPPGHAPHPISIHQSQTKLPVNTHQFRAQSPFRTPFQTQNHTLAQNNSRNQY